MIDTSKLPEGVSVKEVAEKEVISWLDKKKVLKSEREDKEESIKLLIECVCEGILVLEDNFNWTHKLQYPLEADGKVTMQELTYLSRINDKLMEPNLKGIKMGDGDGRFNALIATLTKQPKAIIASLDTADKKIAMAIGIFFL